MIADHFLKAGFDTIGKAMQEKEIDYKHKLWATGSILSLLRIFSQDQP